MALRSGIMLEELERHPNALAVLGPALGLVPASDPNHHAPSHAYLFYGPGGAGKRELTREIAARLLSQGAPDPASAQARALAGVHPDLTWVVPSGAHEILVVGHRPAGGRGGIQDAVRVRAPGVRDRERRPAWR